MPATEAGAPPPTRRRRTDADVTFAAIGDIHDSWSELGEAYDFWDAQGVDATLFVGDLTNSATASEFQGLKDTIDSKAGYGIQLVAALGNHDVSSLGSYDLFTNSTGGQAPNADYVINGYHFITVSPGSGTLDTATGRPSVASSGNYAYAAAWVQQRLALATAEDPTKPVFVLVHHPLKCTHYVSNEWYGSGLTNGQCGSQLTSVFDGFPQAVVWGGHIHTPQNISSSIWQGQEGRSGTGATQGFTTVNAPPLAYFEFESGVVNTSPTSRGNDSTPDDAGNSRQTAIVEVRGSEVTIKNYDLLADQWIDQTWTWDVADAIDTSLSYDERFPLNNTHRASQTSAPVWPAGSAVAVTGIASDKAMVTFPQAVPAPNAVQDIVHKYRYTTVDVATGATVNTFLQWSGFYNLPLPASRNHEVWGLTAGREYEVRVTPVNTWGKEGAALTARFTAGEGGTTPGQPFDPTALTFEQLAEPIPSADLLDIDFGGGTVADLSPRAHAVTQGTAPIAVDPVLGKEAATYTADSAQGSRIAWSDADYAAHPGRLRDRGARQGARDHDRARHDLQHADVGAGSRDAPRQRGGQGDARAVGAPRRQLRRGPRDGCAHRRRMGARGGTVRRRGPQGLRQRRAQGAGRGIRQPSRTRRVRRARGSSAVTSPRPGASSTPSRDRSASPASTAPRCRRRTSTVSPPVSSRRTTPLHRWSASCRRRPARAR